MLTWHDILPTVVAGLGGILGCQLVEMCLVGARQRARSTRRNRLRRR